MYQPKPSLFDKPLAERAVRRERDADECIRAAFIKCDTFRALRSTSFTQSPLTVEDSLQHIKVIRHLLLQAENQLRMVVVPPELAALAYDTINATDDSLPGDEHRLTKVELV